MKILITRLFCFTLLLTAGITGYTQTKPAPKTKSTPTQKAAPPADNKAAQAEGQSTPPAEAQPAIPSLPNLDTTAAPDDELSKQIKKMLTASGAMNMAVENMKYILEMQRKNPAQGLPGEFYDRFLQTIENGRVARLFENAIVKVYREKFTLTEIKDVNAFYATSTGKKVAAELMAVNASSREAGEKIGGFLAIQIVQDMMKEGKLK